MDAHDPIGLDGGINTFGYGYQNPVLNTDPTGERGGRIPAWVVAYVCKKDPKRCKEFVKCVINPASCKKRFCQKSPNRIYHGSNNNGVCEAGACRPEDSLGTRIVKANAALACAAVRKFVSVACHGGSMDSGHRREYNEAVKRAKDCAGGGCL